MFFEKYTEKLWGRHPREISADWGAQRVKGLSILAIIKDMFSKMVPSKKNRKVETSLIEEFMNSKNIFSKIAYLYITLPFLIFIIGWTKWFIAVPVSIAIVYTLFRLFQKEDFLWQPNWDSNSIRLFFLIVIIIGIWVYFSGIGGFAFQNDDHRWRNEIFQMLVWYDWPLVKDVTINNLAETRGMIYYIGFWLPSAIIGKIFGMRAGYLFQMLWAILGLTLVYYYVCAYIKKLSVYPLLAMIFFSGLDIVGYYMVNNDLNGLTNNSHIEFWCGFAQYSSMTTQLFLSLIHI